MRTLFIAVPLLAACAEERAPQSAPTAAPSTSPAPTVSPEPAAALTPDGWGPLRIDMTRAEVEAALGPDADPQAVGGPEPERCDQFRPARAPDGMIVMVEDGRLTRISLIRDATVATGRGLRLGATTAAVRAAHGDALRIERHEYVPPPGAYLTHWVREGGAAARGVRYEVGASGRVEAIHAGGPSITYSEGCA